MKELQDTLTVSEGRLQVERERISKLSTELNQERQQRTEFQTESSKQAKKLESLRTSYESERQRSNQLYTQLKKEKEQKDDLKRKVKQLTSQLELASKREEDKRNESTRKQKEIENIVGCPVTVRRVGSMITNDDLSRLTQAILIQLKSIKDLSSKAFSVIRIEYVMNDRLYRQFDETRTAFRRLGRNSQEVLLFHGTNPSNIDL